MNKFFIKSFLALTLVFGAGQQALAQPAQTNQATATRQPIATVMHKTPWCGCCGAYADYLEENGFSVKRVDYQDLAPIKQRLGTSQAASCHTLEVDDYVVEGHVPVEAINKMLNERPDIHGIALPGMPMNSPGMGPEKKGSLKILSLEQQGRIKGLYLHL